MLRGCFERIYKPLKIAASAFCGGYIAIYAADNLQKEVLHYNDLDEYHCIIHRSSQECISLNMLITVLKPISYLIGFGIVGCALDAPRYVAQLFVAPPLPSIPEEKDDDVPDSPQSNFSEDEGNRLEAVGEAFIIDNM